MSAPANLAWLDRAACADESVDSDWFHSHDRAEQALAIEVCDRCPVRPECLASAVTTRARGGIWGGMTWRDRQRLARAAAQAVIAPGVGR